MTLTDILNIALQTSDEFPISRETVIRWFTESNYLLRFAENVSAVEREKCARIAEHACLVPPDGGSPTDEERLLCDDAARRIRAQGVECVDDFATPRRKAPWPDFEGNDIYEGDMLRHPSGEKGAVVFDPSKIASGNPWRVRYSNGETLWLGNQVGGKGRAIVWPLK